MIRDLLKSKKGYFELKGLCASLDEAKQLIKDFPDKKLQLQIPEFHDSLKDTTTPEEVKNENRLRFFEELIQLRLRL